MSRLTELIEELCPDGVEYRPLGEIADLQRGGGMPKKLFIDEGIPAIHYGHIFTKYGIHTKCAAAYLAPEDADKLTRVYPGDLVVANTSENLEDVGKGVVWLGEAEGVTGGHATVVRSKTVDSVFLSYFLRTENFALKKRKYSQGTKVVELSAANLSKIDIPVPPLAVQREIVRILDQFTTLEAELEAELELRRTQYEHYRNHLLSYESLAARGPVEMVKLGELAHIATGGRNTSDAVENGTYPFYVRSQVPLSLNEYDFDESAVLTAGDGVGVGKVFHHVEGKYALHQRAYRIVPNLELLSSRYLYHVMVSQFGRYLESTVFHSSVTSVRKPMLERFPVAVPPMEEQDRVADVLDRFNALVNDITSGLPAEIAARRAQYEHYRERLLSFPEKAVSRSDAS